MASKHQCGRADIMDRSCVSSCTHCLVVRKENTWPLSQTCSLNWINFSSMSKYLLIFVQILKYAIMYHRNRIKDHFWCKKLLSVWYKTIKLRIHWRVSLVSFLCFRQIFNECSLTIAFKCNILNISNCPGCTKIIRSIKLILL